eukprot:c21418_g1_i1.p1 GENE.c21418_g1_i1~~c21418_g1_i1.p1  ORF type:complete len:312 (-),score=115.66 c21418_g1_i1:119-1033(-)
MFINSNICVIILLSLSCIQSIALPTNKNLTEGLTIERETNNLKWGPVGHSITGDIAQLLLNDEALRVVKTLIPLGNISAVSSWADEVKSEPQYRWSAMYHFVDTPDWVCNFNQQRDCPQNNCLISAISNYTHRLTTTDGEQQQEAFKFLVHFIGDLHQPLHLGFVSDRGGNSIRVSYFSSQSNLHSVWDSAIIGTIIHQQYSGYEQDFVADLINRINANNFSTDVSQWLDCPGGLLACPSTWAQESVAFACNHSYVDADGNKIASGDNLDQSYVDQNSEVIKTLLAKAGYRMAAFLNNLLGSKK